MFNRFNRLPIWIISILSLLIISIAAADSEVLLSSDTNNLFYYVGDIQWYPATVGIPDTDSSFLSRGIWATKYLEIIVEDVVIDVVTVGMIDLRTSSQLGIKGPGTQCCVLYALTSFNSDNTLVPIGNDTDGLTITLTVPERNAIAIKLGLPPASFSSSTPETIIEEILTKEADATGVTRWKPILPTRELDIKINIGNLQINRKFDETKDPLVFATHANDYVETKAYEESIGSIHHEEVLGGWEIKYGVSGVEKIAPGEKRRRPGTIESDDFNRSNNDTLGLDWTELGGDIDILSNRACIGTGNEDHTATWSTAIGSSDMIGKLDHVQDNSGARSSGPSVRNDVSAETMYVGRMGRGFWSNEIGKVITGTYTRLNREKDPTPSTPFKVELDISGSSLELFQDDSLVETSSDTSITSGTRGGLYMISLAILCIDDWQIDDLISVGARNRTHTISLLDEQLKEILEREYAN